tara:strand:+ start:248 stop:484 length:237 start_codon:yes stop_codon:yes gene_type:complete
MWNMKSTLLFVASLVAVILISMSMASADVNTKITDTKDKIVNHLANEKAKTIEFQKKSWANAKKQWPWNIIFKGDNND